MKSYVITNSDNVIIGSGVVQNNNARHIDVPNGCTIHFGVEATIGATKMKLLGGKVIDTNDHIVPTTYQTQRRNAYPPIEAQMDMLWHAMHTGTTPKVEPFYSSILAVKLQHPKPSN